MDYTVFEKFVVVIITLLAIGFPVGAIYIAWHFISKFW